MKKLVLITLTIIVIAISFAGVYAEEKVAVPATGDISYNAPTGTAPSAVTNLSGYIWGSVVTIVRILALAAVAFVGISYMFAESGEKAKLKERLILVAIGALLVFAAPTVIELIINIFKGFSTR